MARFTFQLAQSGTVPERKEKADNLIRTMQSEPNHAVVDVIHKTAELRSRIYKSKKDFLSYIEVMVNETCYEDRKLPDQILTVWINKDKDFFMTFCFNVDNSKVNSGVVFSLTQFWKWEKMELKDMWYIITTQISEIDDSKRKGLLGLIDDVRYYLKAI